MRRQTARTWVEVSRRALIGNLAVFQGAAGRSVKIAPVIKANGYGHGMSWVAGNIGKSQIWGFCVAYGSEALELVDRFRNSRILVLSAWENNELPELIRRRVRLVAWDEESLARIARASRRLDIPAQVHLKLDIGTSRIGTRPELFKRLLIAARQHRSILLDGVFSHYANSENASLQFAREQQRRFEATAGTIAAPWKHLACTAASLRLDPGSTNLVRLGLGLYGLWPSIATRESVRRRLQPVLAWYSHVLQVKQLPAGTSVGYDRTFRTRRTMTMAVLPVGYSDGYDRRASNRSEVAIAGRRCPIVGRVSMNLMMVDVTRLKTVRPGDPVELIGLNVTADRLADDWGTINYEIVSRINSSIPRVAVA